MPEVTYALDGGVVSAKDDSSLDPERGELVQAVGIWYKQGAGEAQMKAGRTAFNGTSLGVTGLSGLYAEFSALDALDQFVVRADTSLFYDDAGIGGTGWHTASGLTLVSGSLGLWAAFSNERYNMNDGASAPWIMRYDANTNTFVFRHAGLRPVAFQPNVTAQVGGAAQIVRPYPATVTASGDVPMDAAQLLATHDADKLTYGTVTLQSKDDTTRLVIGDFRLNSDLTGGAGSTSEWGLEATLEIVTTGSAKTTNLLEYCTDFGTAQTWKQLDKSFNARTKFSPSVVFGVADGSISSADLGLRLTVTKTNTASKGDATINFYDARIYNTVSAAETNGAISTDKGVYYWVTERIDSEGIGSAVSRNADGTPSISKLATITKGSGFLVTLPTAATNPAATHYDVWRTTDGGVYPNGTLVTSVLITSPNPPASIIDTSDPFAAASASIYGYFNIGGVIFDRDMPPPVATVMTTFQNVIVVAPVDEPNVIRYSASGYPESFPLMNRVALSSDRDDTVRGLGVLSNVLGVFMKGRIRRITHLPTPTDPTFGADPEDIATDHGVESLKGIAPLTPSNGEAALLAYVARDGIRITDLYRSKIVTVNIDWTGTVDVSALNSSQLVNNSFYSRLEFFFTPTTEFAASIGLPVNAKAVMWLHYVIDSNGALDMTRLRCTFHPATSAWAFSAPIAGRDYTFILSGGDGATATRGILYVDEVGTGDESLSFDALGTVPHRFRTGRLHPGPTKRVRTRIQHIVLDRQSGMAGAGRITVTVGRDDRSEIASRSYDFEQIDGALSRPVNMSSQWVQCDYRLDTVAGEVAPTLVDLAYEYEILGAFV